MIGTSIHNYLVVRKVGAGGMGSVYLAQHPIIGRRVAIKVLHPELSLNRTVVTRFFNEARAANAIRHPNIIEVIDVGFLPGSERPYLVMEFLEGETLGQRLTRARFLEAPVAVEIACQTAGALAAAHARGVIHRDLKPDNLFLMPPPSEGRPETVKVVDFGIAKLHADLIGDLSADQVRTMTGSLLGTPRYMSPEQCRGAGVPVDQRSDIYSLGVILYHMLCGSPPFVTEGFGDILVMHITQKPEPPSARNPQVPRALDAVVMRALEKDPQARFPSMEAFAAALARVRDQSMKPSAAAGSGPAIIGGPGTAVKVEPGDIAVDSAPVSSSTTLSRTTGQLAVQASLSRPGLSRGLGAAAAVVLAAVGVLAWRPWRAPAAPERPAPVASAAPQTAPPSAPDGGLSPAAGAADARAPGPDAPARRRRPADW